MKSLYQFSIIYRRDQNTRGVAYKLIFTTDLFLGGFHKGREKQNIRYLFGN